MFRLVWFRSAQKQLDIVPMPHLEHPVDPHLQMFIHRLKQLLSLTWQPSLPFPLHPDKKVSHTGNAM